MSFRSAVNTVEKIREQIRRVLQLPPPTRASNQAPNKTRKSSSQLIPIKEDIEEPDMNTSMEVESAINTYLRRSSETFDLGKNYEVCEIYHSVISANFYKYHGYQCCAFYMLSF